MNVLVIGASRGIGLEFVRQYRAEGHRVTATARESAGLERLQALGAQAFALDVADAASASGLGRRVEGVAFDVALVNAGVYGPSTSGMEPPVQADFDQVMHTNVLGPMRLLPQLPGALVPGAKLAVLSSLMGSIGLRSGTSGWLYRASKAALNSVLKDASLALAGQAVCVALHPGWVQTDMGGPNAEITPELSVRNMRALLAALKPGDNGGYFAHDGERLAW
jgi:NAD(P)-dependent dehydrogenase (short-subunit alcohol dehydrogenase family)